MPLIQKCSPEAVETIELGSDPYVDHLYGCFRLDNPRTEGFRAERDVEIVMRSGKEVHVKVPESMKVGMPQEGKVVNTDLFRLEPVGEARDTMKLLTMRAGWNQTDADIDRIIDFDPNGTFCAYLEGDGHRIPVGTCTVAPLGRTNTWIGMILVHPEVRRQGIANFMMQHCVQYAIRSDKIINGLDATPMGNTVYGAVGYVDSFRLWRCVYPTAQFQDVPVDTKQVRRMEAGDLDRVIAYDASRFLEREAILQALFADADGEAYVALGEDGDLAGYVLGRSGRIRPFVGPFIAETEAMAEALLTTITRSYAAKGEETLFIDTPELHFAERGKYVKGVFDQEQKPSSHKLIPDLTPVRDFTRMYQVVDLATADQLVEAFMNKEKLPAGHARVDRFAAAMHRAVQNRTETLAFMEYEARELQPKVWGITGPEKG